MAISLERWKSLNSTPKDENNTPRQRNNNKAGIPDLLENLVATIARNATKVISNKFIYPPRVFDIFNNILHLYKITI